MAKNYNGFNDYNNSSRNNNQKSKNDNPKNKNETIEDKKASLESIEKVMSLDDIKDTYVEEAHKVIVSFLELQKNDVISKTKIRSIYNMLCDIIADEEHSELQELSGKSQNALKMFKIRVIYDCGRDKDDKSIRIFTERSHIIGYMLDIGNSKEKFNIFCKYFEALVAYHRFLYGDTK